MHEKKIIKIINLNSVLRVERDRYREAGEPNLSLTSE